MKTLEEVFANNLREFRGDATQAAFSERLGVPFVTYQRLESGRFMPQQETRTKITERLGVPEGRLFADPDYVATPGEALRILEKLVKQAESREEQLSQSARALSDMLPALDEDKAAFLLSLARDLGTDGSGNPVDRARAFLSRNKLPNKTGDKR